MFKGIKYKVKPGSDCPDFEPFSDAYWICKWSNFCRWEERGYVRERIKHGGAENGFMRTRFFDGCSGIKEENES